MTLTFDDQQPARLLDLLGLPADTTDSDLVLATVEDLTQQAASMQKPSDVAASAKAIGMELVDNDAIESLRRDAAEGRQIKAAAERQRIEAAVDTAVNRGAITPARKQHWIALAAADPGMLDVLAATPDETAMPITELGHGIDLTGDHPNADEWFR